MKLGFPAKFLLAVILAVLSSGCLVHRTVTTGGQTTSSGYKFTNPFKSGSGN